MLAQTPRLIVGTAGHVDHGKTALIHALTGVNCDRLPEEQARGLTIDLGFAALRSKHASIGFVDVPGHHKYVHNAIAGFSSVDAILLVIAANEGIKPQTEEHLRVCALLDVPRCIVVVTKIDTVLSESVDRLRLTIRDWLANGPYALSPIVGVSAQTTEGVAELVETLENLARSTTPACDSESPVRLRVDRAFGIPGHALIVTGSLRSGSISPHQLVHVMPGDRAARVRSVEVHGQRRDIAYAGERTAISLGGIRLSDVSRGSEICTPGSLCASNSLCLRVRPELLDPLARLVLSRRGRLDAVLHLGAAEVPAIVRVVREATASTSDVALFHVQATERVAVATGDRAVFYAASPPRLLGGGEVADPQWRPTRRRPTAEYVGALRGGELAEAVRCWLGESKERGVSREELSARTGLPGPALEAEIAKLERRGAVLHLSVPSGAGRWITMETYQAVFLAAKTIVSGNRRLTKNAVVRAAARRCNARFIDAWVDLFEHDGLFADADTDEMDARVVSLVDGRSPKPLRTSTLQTELNVEHGALERSLRRLIEQGRLSAVGDGWVIDAASLRRCVSELASLRCRTQFTVSQFREALHLNRESAIVILEHFDTLGITRRSGPAREVTGGAEHVA